MFCEVQFGRILDDQHHGMHTLTAICGCQDRSLQFKLIYSVLTLAQNPRAEIGKSTEIILQLMDPSSWLDRTLLPRHSRNIRSHQHHASE